MLVTETLRMEEIHDYLLKKQHPSIKNYKGCTQSEQLANRTRLTNTGITLFDYIRDKLQPNTSLLPCSHSSVWGKSVPSQQKPEPFPGKIAKTGRLIDDRSGVGFSYET